MQELNLSVMLMEMLLLFNNNDIYARLLARA